MGHGMSKKKEQKIIELTMLRKRSLHRSLILLAIMIFILVARNVLIVIGVDWINNSVVNMVMLMAVVVVAAASGMGFSKWSRYGKQIKSIKTK